MTTVSLQSTQLESNLFRIDVLIESLPEHFVGLGFDLMMDQADWSFEKYELGGIFHQPENVLVLAVPKDEPSRLVFGLSLKGESLSIPPKLSDGTVVSFYLRAHEVNFQLANQVLSVLDQGRKDVTDVTWEVPGGSTSVISEPISGSWLESPLSEPQETFETPDGSVVEAVHSPENPGIVVDTPDNRAFQVNTLSQDLALPLLFGILTVLVILLVVSKIRRKGLT